MATRTIGETTRGVNGMSLWSRNIPLLAEEGWLRHQKNAAKPPKRRSRGGQTGATFRRTLIEASPYQARASRPARQLLLSCRATPPLRGGECAPPIRHRNYEKQY